MFFKCFYYHWLCVVSQQVTPDLLKGQQEVSVDPPEEAGKQILFTYLKNG